ncbi:MAG: translation elongation factor Ts [Burkholderiaceae bacterium]|nr:translation elongation factor Ts [Burkholderiaceae bacterium]
MVAITAGMVGELRAKTDAPMMECKKALTEAQGDMARAEEILRVRLGNKAGKAASRVAAEGLVGVYIAPDGKTGAMIEVNCETDFVTKNDDFIGLVKACAELVATKHPVDVAALSALPMGEGTVESTRTALVGKIGENMTIRRFKYFSSPGRLASYIHNGRIGVMVEFEGDDVAAKDVAMHIAATKPLALDASGVPADKIETERSIATQKAAESGKPPEIVAKMVEGTVQKYLKEVALLSQPFVKNDKETVEQMLKSKSTKIHSFTLYVVGEGITKVVTDFAAEVAAQVAATKG